MRISKCVLFSLGAKMILKSLLVQNASALKTCNQQMLIECANGTCVTQPLEDIGLIDLDSTRTMISSSLLAHFAENNIALMVSGQNHHPVSLMLPLSSHSSHTERIRPQITASLPVRKRLWQEVVRAKIRNQADVLSTLGASAARLRAMISKVKSGDTSNREGAAAAYYWKALFREEPTVSQPFVRQQYGDFPNNLLNYGYAILRAITARAIVATGLHPSIGIFHKNKYNAYCLADDMMEPFRPFVDLYIKTMMFKLQEPVHELSTQIKQGLLNVSYLDTELSQERRPLMNAVQMSCSSLWSCLAGESNHLLLPALCQIDIQKRDDDPLAMSEISSNDYANTELCG